MSATGESLMVSAAVTKTKHGNQQRWSIGALQSQCTQKQMDSTRICDPDKVLSDYSNGAGDDDTTRSRTMNTADYNRIYSALKELETNHPLICSSDSTISSTKKVDVQMAVVAVQKMELTSEQNFMSDDYMIRQGKHYATALHNHYGVGQKGCNGSGILLFLSLQDRVVYISISNGLKPILTKVRIDHIIDEVMKPYLREEEYGEAVIKAIQAIKKYIDNGPPSFWELMLPNVIPMCIVLFFAGHEFKTRMRKKEYTAVHSQLSQLDRDHALALMGKYECTSCPICLQDFKPIQQNREGSGNINIDGYEGGQEIEIKDKYVGSDGRELQVLRCGHAFDKTCWEKWISSPSAKNTHQCPICRADIGKSSELPSSSSPMETSFTTDETTSMLNNRSFNSIDNPSAGSSWGLDRGSSSSSSSSTGIATSTTTNGGIFRDAFRGNNFHRNNHYRFYQTERDFRLRRMHLHHPHFIDQSLVNRWINDNNSSGNQYNPLAQDVNFVRNDPRSVDASSRGRSDSSFSSMGGGSSGGGGGGRW
eukprot:CAMPEP_0204613544 /NCGR_PEP_ID=MMETSP0717-20131115/1483_1 /ASSEMBLY_ACC=CAM_ASM_000666 /TAXON_ID=230516 /ORGANISM="Chaetoceros curvisetus" /LENGTH=534 /DNA_ID=CAMNT_0051625989 /DNA_START=43 /DNA_END=1647 /DNA_ORIENTATION=-